MCLCAIVAISFPYPFYILAPGFRSAFCRYDYIKEMEKHNKSILYKWEITFNNFFIMTVNATELTYIYLTYNSMKN